MSVLAAIGNTISRLVLFVVGAIVALLFMCMALVGLAVILLKALITGRKPVFVTSFMQFRQASEQFRRNGWSNGQRTSDNPTSSGDIIEGQATEIRDDKALPHDKD